MAIYTFYPFQADGSSTTFQAVDLSDDTLAATCARGLLERHRSCVAVEVWCGDRRLVTQRRPVPAQLQSA